LGRPLPAMIAAVQAPDRAITAVQVTLLSEPGRKAGVPTPRLNPVPLDAGAVRLAKAATVLGLAEGIEDALSAMQLHGLPCWAALGAGRMHRVGIPAEIQEIIVFADNDDVGRRAAERVVEAHQKKRRVTVVYPPERFEDWNDYLRAAATARESAERTS
jgi:putative DNA primase/helicase